MSSASVVGDAVQREDLINIFDIGYELSWAQYATLGDAAVEMMRVGMR
jgi:hypothetical protein